MKEKDAYHFAMHAVYDKEEPVMMGPHASYTWKRDPKHLLFSYARYKFCSKILQNKQHVLEIGCGDCSGAPILLQTIGALTCVDRDTHVVSKISLLPQHVKRVTVAVHDILDGPVDATYDGALSIDVIEHIDRSREKRFMTNVSRGITDDGIFIVGTPNVSAARYAGEASRAEHINLKDEAGLRELFAPYFQNTLIFSMNDEVVHTGFSKMAHFLFAVGLGKKKGSDRF